MPIYLDPSASVPFTLPSDAQLPEHCRVEFRVRVVTIGQRMQVDELCSRFATCDPKDEPGIVADVLKMLIVGWGNIKRPDGEPLTDAGQLTEVLTMQEAWDLIYGAMTAVALSEIDRKKSAAPSQEDTPVAS